MTAVDFVLYSAGLGILMMSIGVMILLISRATPRRATKVPGNAPRPERVPDPVDDALTSRLAEFHSARFASPIVQRALRPDTLPIRRGPIRPPRPSKQEDPKKGNQ